MGNKIQLNNLIWFILLLGFRLAALKPAFINDCDEVFNYYEPLHFLQYGNGLKTWEYSNFYRLRSYAYLLPYFAWVKFIEFLGWNKISQFISLRLLFLVLSVIAEFNLFLSLKEKINPKLAKYTLLILLFNSGMIHSAPALLPSTLAMLTTLSCFSFSLERDSAFKWIAILTSLAIGGLWGWPFSAVIGLPLVMEYILNRAIIDRFLRILLISLLVGLIVGTPLFLIDSWFYNKLTLVPFNLVAYNVFNSSASRGPDIFGVEPWDYYFRNLLLNFNLVLPLALLSLPLYLLNRCIIGKSKLKMKSSALVVRLSLVYVWLIIFSLQPHKEERFMYVIYPLICFNGALALYELQSLTSYVFGSNLNSKRFSQLTTILCFILYCSLSISRSFGQYYYYNGNIKVYEIFQGLELNPSQQYNLCLGDNWYHFPSHYYLPPNVHLKFIKQSFNGLLPKPYEANGWKVANDRENDVNDMNILIENRFVLPEQCDFQIKEFNNTSKINHKYCEKVLEKDSLSSLLRAFYLPFLSGNRNIRWNHNCLITT